MALYHVPKQASLSKAKKFKKGAEGDRIPVEAPAVKPLLPKFRYILWPKIVRVYQVYTNII